MLRSGASYFNLTSETVRVCAGPTLPCTWENVGGGGGSGCVPGVATSLLYDTGTGCADTTFLYSGSNLVTNPSTASAFSMGDIPSLGTGFLKTGNYVGGNGMFCGNISTIPVCTMTSGVGTISVSPSGVNSTAGSLQAPQVEGTTSLNAHYLLGNVGYCAAIGTGGNIVASSVTCPAAGSASIPSFNGIYQVNSSGSPAANQMAGTLTLTSTNANSFFPDLHGELPERSSMHRDSHTGHDCARIMVGHNHNNATIHTHAHVRYRNF